MASGIVQPPDMEGVLQKLNPPAKTKLTHGVRLMDLDRLVLKSNRAAISLLLCPCDTNRKTSVSRSESAGEARPVRLRSAANGAAR